jgi:hypothetical protein
VTDNAKEISSELQNRLDDFFDASADAPEDPSHASASMAEDDTSSVPAQGAPPEVTTGSTFDSPLLNLNATILSLDWEITDATLDRLLKEIDRLKAVYQRDKLPFMFLQLLGSIGKYISVKKVNAHPDAIRMLHSVYAGLEKVLLSDISNHDKKKLLSNEVRQFKSLKQRIRRAKPTADKEMAAAEPISPVLPSEPPAPSPALTAAAVPVAETANTELLLAEVRKVIRDEFSAFKTELRAMLGEE